MRLFSTYTIFLLSFLTFLIFSIIYSEERIIILDNALHTFLCINNNELGIMAGRWPISIVRIGLYTGINVGLSLAHLITIYSISHMLLKWILVAFALKIGGRRYLAISLITLLIPLCHSYFWCVSELIPALLMIIPLALLLDKNRITQKHYLLLLLIPIAYFSHPQSMLAIVYLVLYKITKSKVRVVSLILSTLGIVLLIKKCLFQNWYDTMKMEGLKKNLVAYNFSPFNTESFNQLSNWVCDSLFWVPILYLLCSYLLAKDKRWFKLLLYNGFMWGTAYLFIMSNPERVNSFYAESSTYLLSFYSAFVILDYLKKQKLLLGLCIFIILFSLTRILIASSKYKERLNYVETLTEKRKLPKLVVDQQNVDLITLGLDWGLPYETLLVSELRGKKTITIVTEDQRRAYSQFADQKAVLFNGLGNVFDIKDARRYFNLDFDDLYSWENKKKGDQESDKEINH